MGEHTRRNVLRGGLVATAAGVAAPALEGRAVADAGAEAGAAPPGPVKVGRSEARYPSLATRGYNRRFVGNPGHVWVVGTTAHVVRAVQDAVDGGRRVTVRSGGHGFEGFVADPDVEVVVDMSAMTAVHHDPARRAFCVEAGAELGEMYRRLYVGWGVTVPAGWCPTVGAGGHVLGGGFGPLSRSMGLAVDHLYAVEVVVVDRRGTARSVIATREPSDPHRDLWWAHTGGGGGGFGIVTRYWFRTPGVDGTDPGRLLPAPPSTVLSFSVAWDWRKFGRTSFARLVRNHGEWVERNSGPDSPFTRLYSELQLNRVQLGTVGMIGQVAGPDAEGLLESHLAAINRDVPVEPVRTVQRRPWLAAALAGSPGDPGPAFRMKVKSAYLRRRLTDRQIDVVHHHLTRSDYDHPGGSMSLYTFGGRVSTVRPDATAAPHRDAIMKIFVVNGWVDAADDARHIGWLRDLYRDLYADTGGVPAAGDGAFINYPDVDLADPALNRGAPWQTLYFGDNHRRLQRVKAEWDPRDVFRHALSVRAS